MKGSMTIEASIIVPLLLAVYLFVIKGAVGIYQETVNRTPLEKYSRLWEVDDFYRYDSLKKLAGSKGETNDK